MFLSYLKLAWRNIIRNKLSSFINILGLALAVGCSIVVFIFVDYNQNRDRFHEQGEHIFLLENVINRGGDEQVWGDSPLPIGPMLAADFPQIERVVRVRNYSGSIQYGDKIFNEGIRFVEPEFLSMFSFELAKGQKNALEDPSAIVISQEMAEKFFGEEDPMEKTVSITFRDTLVQSFTVKGVAEKFPVRASFWFDFLIQFDRMKQVDPDLKFDDWKRWTGATFVQVQNPEDIHTIQQQMGKYQEIQNAVNEDWSVTSFLFDNLYNLGANSHEVRGDISGGSPPAAIITLSLIGIFLISLACFNYMNIAIASAARRMKEIGVRKVVGGSRWQLIRQFIGENLLLCLVALVLGVVLAHFFFLPGFNSAVNEGPAIDMPYGSNAGLWLFFVGILALTGIGAGAYPAFFVSSFDPVSIFRGKQKLKGNNVFTRILLTTQFVLSFLLILAGIVFSLNANYQRNVDWGYNQESTVVVRTKGKGNFKAFRDKIQNHPNIVATAGSRNHVGRSYNTAVIEYQGEKIEIQRIDVSPEYLETIGIRLREGRLFNREMATDAEGVIINQMMVDKMGWENPLTEQFTFDSTRYSVIGVVEDFHYANFFDGIDPALFRLAKEDQYNYLAVRAKAGTVVQMNDYLKATWTEMVPAIPYDGFFQDQVFDETFRESDGIRNIFIAVAIIALLLTCMGLFGLVSLNIAKRMKEFSIRKVLGASMSHVARLVNQQFVIMISIAIVLAIPIGYIGLNGLLDDIFEVRIPLDPWPFLFTGIVIFGTAILTISAHLYKVAKANPVDALRNE